MDPWAWIAAYVVGFALLQLLLYRYLTDETRGADAVTPNPGESGAMPAAGGETTAGEAVACRHCGAENAREQGFRFCRECIEPLR